jgi:hypothetical protein
MVLQSEILPRTKISGIILTNCKNFKKEILLNKHKIEEICHFIVNIEEIKHKYVFLSQIFTVKEYLLFLKVSII